MVFDHSFSLLHTVLAQSFFAPLNPNSNCNKYSIDLKQLKQLFVVVSEISLCWSLLL